MLCSHHNYVSVHCLSLQELGRLVGAALSWFNGDEQVQDELLIQKRLRLETSWLVPWLERVSATHFALLCRAMLPLPPPLMRTGSEWRPMAVTSTDTDTQTVRIIVSHIVGFFVRDVFGVCLRCV